MSSIEDFRPYFNDNSYTVPYPSYSIKVLLSSNKIKFDHKDKKLLYHKYWKDKNIPIYIIYDITLKLNKIKKVLETIPSHEFQIKNILIKAEKQIRFLRNIYNSLLLIDAVKYKSYINQCVY
jgi:hypothetical protein